MISLILNMQILKHLWNVQQELSSSQSGICCSAVKQVGLQRDLEVIKHRGSGFNYGMNVIAPGECVE